jgi:DNA-binding NarL/FixJ family response regulator
VAARILIVDDHPVVRAGLRVFLDQHDDLEVIAEAGSLAEARACTATTRFDLVLLDLRLPDGGGGALIPELTGAADSPKVVVLTSTFDDHDVRRAVRAGAHGFLLKHAGPAALLDGVRAALRGEVPLDPTAVRALASPREDVLATLTPRERDVLALLARGASNKRIAAELGIAEKTVKAHAGNLFHKLGVRDRVQAALRAKELGL